MTSITTDLYLWVGSACTYPGIRRKTGKNEQTGGVGVQSLQLDRSGNHMAHRVWELLGITKSGFKIDRKGYELVHLFPHKAAEWQKLLKILAAAPGVAPVPTEWSTHLTSHGLPGLFTNPANMCFLPSVLVRPTDGNSLLRQVLWKKALSLYGSAALLPPELASPMQQWLALQPEPTVLEWSECYHGDASLLHKLLTDRASHLTHYQPTA